MFTLELTFFGKNLADNQSFPQMKASRKCPDLDYFHSHHQNQSGARQVFFAFAETHTKICASMMFLLLSLEL